MNYELAKKLEEAGFPVVINNDTGDGIWRSDVVHWEPPTLSELIEACGRGLQSLINNSWDDERGGWIAFTNHKDEHGERMEIWGSTPEEAVANLYLTLHPHE